MTPLQAAVMASVFANKGQVVEPWVVQSVGDHEIAHRPPHQIGWSASTMDTMLTGMRMVVREPAGTGHRAFTPLISIAGKTGTAQTQIIERPHGWFVGFCPVEHPRIAIAIVAEHGGSGGDLPSEIARTICEYVAAPDTL
jgi:cell division protein FtsI/penicillin-binding protein 2